MEQAPGQQGTTAAAWAAARAWRSRLALSSSGLWLGGSGSVRRRSRRRSWRAHGAAAVTAAAASESEAAAAQRHDAWTWLSAMRCTGGLCERPRTGTTHLSRPLAYSGVGALIYYGMPISFTPIPPVQGTIGFGSQFFSHSLAEISSIGHQIIRIANVKLLRNSSLD